MPVSHSGRTSAAGDAVSLRTIVLLGALTWVSALVVLIAGVRFHASRVARARWIALGLLMLVPGDLLGSLAADHNWPRQQAVIASDIDGVCVLAFFACIVTTLITGLRRKPRRPMQDPKA
jgi:hypothetical protein